MIEHSAADQQLRDLRQYLDATDPRAADALAKRGRYLPTGKVSSGTGGIE